MPDLWTDGCIYALSLVAILGAHEMGHFLQAVRYRVPASFPYFLPMPFNPFGTMGAVINMRIDRANRRQLFDIGISGPLAGLVVCIPLLWYGLWISTPIKAPQMYGEPLFWKFSVWLIHGSDAVAPGMVVPMNPISMAGWVGLFVTGLNMMPFGQLDGGHITYLLFGRRASFLGWAVLGGSVLYMWWTRNETMGLMLLLLLFMGPDHPRTADEQDADYAVWWYRLFTRNPEPQEMEEDEEFPLEYPDGPVPLGRVRTVLGYVSLAIPLLCLTPTPLVSLTF